MIRHVTFGYLISMMSSCFLSVRFRTNFGLQLLVTVDAESRTAHGDDKLLRSSRLQSCHVTRKWFVQAAVTPKYDGASIAAQPCVRATWVVVAVQSTALLYWLWLT